MKQKPLFFPSQSNLALILFFWQVAMPVLVQGQITLDGTTGPAGALGGPNYQVTADLGTQHGANLFHSFGVFNINYGESATFSGPAEIANIISRVTGGSSSTIDGLLRSTIAGADFYLLNPAGVLFGPHAALDIQGSFHVSTADYLKLGDSGQFSATAPAESVLTADPPAAFGFLSDTPAPIRFEGSGSADAALLLPGFSGNGIKVPDGETISIIGGDITIGAGNFMGLWPVETRIIAPGGEINLVSLGGPGELPLNTLELTDLTAIGDITIEGHSSSLIDVSGDRGGLIRVRGNNILVDQGNIWSKTTGGEGGLGIDIVARGDFTIQNDGMISGLTSGNGKGSDITIKAETATVNSSGHIVTNVLGAGDGGDIDIEAATLTITNGGAIGSAVNPGATGNGGNLMITARDTVTIADYGGIYAPTFGSKDGGSIAIETAVLNISNWGRIEDSVGVGATGNGGDIQITATDSVSIDGSGFVSIDTSGSGHGGSFSLETAKLDIDNGGSIRSRVFATGNGGDIQITAMDSVSIDGSGSVSTATHGSGHGGSLALETSKLDISNGGSIRANVFNALHGGDIQIMAKDSVSIDSSGIVSTATLGSGHGGSLTIETAKLDITNGGAIEANVYNAGNGGDIQIAATDSVSIDGSGFVSTATDGSGYGGNLSLETAELVITNGGGIMANTFATGHGGDIQIMATDSVSIDDSGFVSTETSGTRNSGTITVEAANRLWLHDGGSISASSTGNGQAGSIIIQGQGGHAVREVVLEGYADDMVFSLPDGRQVSGSPSGLFLNATGVANGGNLNLLADRLVVRDGAMISAIAAYGSTSETSGGSIAIDAGSVELAGGGLISAATSGPGQAGDITLNVTDEISISGVFDRTKHPGITNPRVSDNSGIQNGATYSLDPNATELGSGGSVTVNAGKLSISDHGEISVSTEGAGDGGDVVIRAKSMTMLSEGTVSSTSTGTGKAGFLDIDAGRSFYSNHGRITTEALQGDGGNISLKAIDLIHLVDSSITTSVQGGTGNGGNIFIDPAYVILDHSQISANAWGGNGGNINITAGTFIKDQESTLSASSALGISGAVTIDSPSTDVSSAMVVMPINFLEDINLAVDACAARTVASNSSLVQEDDDEPLPGENVFLVSATQQNASHDKK